MGFVPAPEASTGSERGLCSEVQEFKRLDFATLRARSGDDIVIERMKDAGVAPWAIRVGRKYPVSR
jgi:hypothetical protein